MELKAHPEALSRARYKQRFIDANSAMPEQYQDRDYDRLVGDGRDTVNAPDITDEITRLEEVTEGLRQYVNKRIAHRDEDHFADVPRFHDVDAALEYLEQLVLRYLHLFRAISMRTLLPTWQYDWKEVFRHPWIVSKDRND